MRLNSRALGIVVVIAFTAGIGGTMAMNLWYTESRKIPAVYTEGDLTGTPDPGDIRGSYSFGDIEKAFGVPARVLGEAFEVQSDPGTFLCKELETMYAGLEFGEIGTDAVRLFVARYLELPYEPHDDTLLPGTAIDILGDRLDEDTRARMEALGAGDTAGVRE